MSSTATNFSYEIGDGYGYIDVRQWLDSSDDESGKTEGIGQDKFVSVIGTIKTFGGKRHVSAQTIRPIEDHNEVYHHFLKALQVSLSIRNPGAVSGSTFNADDRSRAKLRLPARTRTATQRRRLAAATATVTFPGCRRGSWRSCPPTRAARACT